MRVTREKEYKIKERESKIKERGSMGIPLSHQERELLREENLRLRRMQEKGI